MIDSCILLCVQYLLIATSSCFITAIATHVSHNDATVADAIGCHGNDYRLRRLNLALFFMKASNFQRLLILCYVHNMTYL